MSVVTVDLVTFVFRMMVLSENCSKVLFISENCIY